MSGKYSKRKIEKMLRESSATLSPEADGRIRRNLGIADETNAVKTTYAEDTAEHTGDSRRNGRRRASFNYSAVIAVAAVLCAAALAVWIRTLHKDPANNSGETGRVSTTVTPTITSDGTTGSPTPAAEIVIGDYTGMTYEQVCDEIGDKLAIRIDWAESDEIAENHVIETMPAAGETVWEGRTIIVIMSQGNSKVVSVPNVVGQTEIDAKAILINAKLNYTTEMAYSDTVPAGTVISQSPDPTVGTVEKGTVINLVISSGEEQDATLTPAAGTDEVLIDEKNFPDPVVRDSVAENWDTNRNGALDAEEISACRNILIRSYDGHELRSLQGIEYLTELETLVCYDSDVTELDVSRNEKLYSLDCNNNKLTKLDLSANVNLANLDVRGNELTELDLSANPKLSRLDCSDNAIGRLDLSGNTALTELYCSSNPLTGLYVPNCKKLTRLECFESGLETINLSSNTELTILNLDGNKLTVLDLSNNGKLTSLDCNRNNLETLTLKPGTPLEYLDCYENKLTSLDVSGLARLLRLNCGKNMLSELDLAGNPELIILTCNTNAIRKLDVSGNPKLEELHCRNCGMSELILGDHPVMVYMEVGGNNFTELDASGCPETADIEVDDCVTVIKSKSGQ